MPWGYSISFSTRPALRAAAFAASFVVRDVLGSVDLLIEVPLPPVTCPTVPAPVVDTGV